MLRIGRRACRWIGVALATAVVMTGCSHTASKTAAPKASPTPPHSPPPPPPPPPTCPLTGVTGGSVPNRPALAVKVENAPESRPPDAQGLPNPTPIFTYSASPPPGGPGALVHADFSAASDVYWHWTPQANAYQRFYGSVPANEANGAILSAANVIVQSVPVTMSWW